jgi:hypothetical protein
MSLVEVPPTRSNMIPQTELTPSELDQVSVRIAAGLELESRAYITTDLAAYLEWYWLRSAGHHLRGLSHTPEFEQLHLQLKSQRELWRSTGGLEMGFLRVRRMHTDTEYLPWVQFRFELERSLVSAGFAQQWAKQLIGAIGELEDNIHFHSESAGTGIIVYRVRNSELECIVLDKGIGVLASLRRCDSFGHLQDHGSALQLALTEGTSRYGLDSGRGWGFRDLFVGLVNSSASLRFRSGDHLLSIEGEKPELSAAVIRQRALGNGLLIAIRARAN